MWNALGNCYKKLDKEFASSKCLEKALVFKDHEGISLFQLGKIYDLLGFEQKAVQSFERNLIKKDEKHQVDKEFGETLLYLAMHYKNIGDNDQAIQYANRLMNFNGIEKEEAQHLIFEINNLKK